jgi:hypothetical protein
VHTWNLDPLSLHYRFYDQGLSIKISVTIA